MKTLLITLALMVSACGQAPGNNSGNSATTTATAISTLSCKINGLFPGGSTFEVSYTYATFADGTYTTACTGTGNISDLTCAHDTPKVFSYLPPSGGVQTLTMSATTNGCATY